MKFEAAVLKSNPMLIQKIMRSGCGQVADHDGAVMGRTSSRTMCSVGVSELMELRIRTTGRMVRLRRRVEDAETEAIRLARESGSVVCER